MTKITANKKILNSVKTIEDAKETITNLLEIIGELNVDQHKPESTSMYQGTAVGFIQS